MKARPILFRPEMILAWLREIEKPGTGKRQTRRLAKPCRDLTVGCDLAPNEIAGEVNAGVYDNAKYGHPGDLLWVRETGWERPERTPKMMREGADTWKPYYYDADGWADTDHDQFRAWGFKRRPSIYMPRWASRITIQLTEVRVEKLHNITPEDAIAEGLHCLTKDGHTRKYGIPDSDGEPGTDDFGWPWKRWDTDPVWAYASLWDEINGAGAYMQNPWVWVLIGKPHLVNVDEFMKREARG